MTESFQQTVDLREKMERQKRTGMVKNKVEPLEKIYQEEEPDEPKADWQKISQPRAGRYPGGLIKLIVFILAGLVVGATVYFLFFRAKSADPEPLARDWYAVKLVDGTIYYGQISDVKANPVVLSDAYYDYDQAKAIKEKKPFIETGNIRLVKRGQETQGGDGSLLLYQDNISLEPLRDDSKILKAILEYQK